ncbi:hypothetical protein CASFOL_029114 [Castilleja foliolosa]|uniref:Uncharacterized protein n=1 Tax=Castilleja foliolosa TaxID=1961234 RepID=A0ABD3CEJ1_9LAMI
MSKAITFFVVALLLFTLSFAAVPGPAPGPTAEDNKVKSNKDGREKKNNMDLDYIYT